MRGRKKRSSSSAPARRTIGYVRVSTDDQAENGVSLEAQEARIRAFAEAMARPLAEVVVDAGQSAKNLTRPGLTKILDEIRAGTVGAVIVVKLDRLTRSVRDLGSLLDLAAKHDVALLSVGESLDTSSAAGRMVVHMLGVVAQWEREAAGERTRSSLTHLRRSARVYGRTPFGYRRSGDRLVTDPNEQIALDRVRTMHADGEGASLRQIGEWLRAEGFAPPQGGTAWGPSSVRALLRSNMMREGEAAARMN